MCFGNWERHLYNAIRWRPSPRERSLTRCHWQPRSYRGRGHYRCAGHTVHKYDCIIFTQTLQCIYDFRAALKTLYRILLRPGGVLLVTIPGVALQISRDECPYWEISGDGPRCPPSACFTKCFHRATCGLRRVEMCLRRRALARACRRGTTAQRFRVRRSGI